MTLHIDIVGEIQWRRPCCGAGWEPGAWVSITRSACLHITRSSDQQPDGGTHPPPGCGAAGPQRTTQRRGADKSIGEASLLIYNNTLGNKYQDYNNRNLYVVLLPTSPRFQHFLNNVINIRFPLLEAEDNFYIKFLKLSWKPSWVFVTKYIKLILNETSSS